MADTACLLLQASTHARTHASERASTHASKRSAAAWAADVLVCDVITPEPGRVLCHASSTCQPLCTLCSASPLDKARPRQCACVRRCCADREEGRLIDVLHASMCAGTRGWLTGHCCTTGVCQHSVTTHVFGRPLHPGGFRLPLIFTVSSHHRLPQLQRQRARNSPQALGQGWESHLKPSDTSFLVLPQYC